MKNFHPVGRGTCERNHNQLMNRPACCPMSQNDRNMTISAILPRFENSSCHASIEVFTRVVALREPVCQCCESGLLYLPDISPSYPGMSFHISIEIHHPLQRGGKESLPPSALPVVFLIGLVLVVSSQLISFFSECLMDTDKNQRGDLCKQKNHKRGTQKVEYFGYHFSLPPSIGKRRFPAVCR